MNIYSLLEFVCRSHNNFFSSLSFSDFRFPDRWDAWVCARFGFDAASFFCCPVSLHVCFDDAFFILLFHSKHQIDHLRYIFSSSDEVSVRYSEHKVEKRWENENRGKNNIHLSTEYSHIPFYQDMEMRVYALMSFNQKSEKYAKYDDKNWMRIPKVRIENHFFHLVSRLPRSLETHFQQWKLLPAWHVSNGDWW